MALKVAVHGAAGRMGRAVLQGIAESAELALAAAIVAPDDPHLGRDAGELCGAPAFGVRAASDLGEQAVDVVVDFSLPEAVGPLLERLLVRPLPLVLATTGLGDGLDAQVSALSQQVPVVAAANYSVGVAVLYHLAKQASALLPDFDLEVVEMHHRHKVDAPSGTALGLARAAAQGRDQDARAAAVYGRQGQVGPRTREEIGIMTLRGGDVVGDHTLILAGDAERLELSHRAGNRGLFARGALRAARWVKGKPAGRYDMADVLGLRINRGPGGAVP